MDDLDHGRHQAIQDYYRTPFRPAQNVKPEFRDSNAFEYIAAQLGRIADTLERIEKRLEQQPNVSGGSQP